MNQLPPSLDLNNLLIYWMCLIHLVLTNQEYHIIFLHFNIHNVHALCITFESTVQKKMHPFKDEFKYLRPEIGK